MSTDLTDDTRDAITRLADLQDRITALTEQADEIRAKLAANLPHGTHAHAGRTVHVYTGVRFDEALALQILPHDITRQAVVARLDSQKVKQLVAPAVYAQCQKPEQQAQRPPVMSGRVVQPCRTGKVPFPTKKAAEDALLAARIRRACRGSDTPREVRTYRCNDCKRWHLTSLRTWKATG